MEKTKNPLPIETLILDGRPGKVEYPKNIAEDSSERTVGEYDPSSRTIKVLNELAPEEAFGVLVHELFHYLWRRRDLNDALKMLKPEMDAEKVWATQEFFVQSLSAEAVEFLRQNVETLQPLGKLWEKIMRGASVCGSRSNRKLLTQWPKNLCGSLNRCRSHPPKPKRRQKA